MQFVLNNQNREKMKYERINVNELFQRVKKWCIECFNKLV